MAIAKIQGIAIKGISCVIPTKKINSTDRYSDFGEDAVNKIIEKTGVESIYQSSEEQTASDLAFVAAKRLIEEKEIDVSTIGALVLVTQTSDYRLPATAFVLQHRLGLPEECMCFDINLGCSGYVNGLYTLSSIMETSNIDRALLLVAETPSKRISPLDRSLSMIFGDCGTATLLEKDPTSKPMNFQFKSLGDRFKKIIVPAGAYRNMDASSERIAWGDGNIRSDYDTYMNGQDVFAFSITEVPEFIKKFMSNNSTTQEDYDNIILHQANQYILKQITKRLKADKSKTPLPMVNYGNTSSTSIPLSIAFMKSEQNTSGTKRLLMAGFGIGLSIATLDATVDMSDVLPISHTDDYFEDGAVSHD